jgi:uncharacterized glyoxalase superfamily protein PhnB
MVADGAFHSAVPVIATEDVAGSVEYFVRTLGFARDFVWGDPPVYAGVKAGSAEIYLTHDAATSRAIRERGLAPDVFLWVTEIDGIYAEHCARGADIVEALSERPWGARQYVVREPNGYHLKIAEASEGDGA